MKFTNALRVLLVLGSYQQADTQTVTVTIGQSGTNVFMEWSGKLTVLPPMENDPFTDCAAGFFSDEGGTDVTAVTDLDCT